MTLQTTPLAELGWTNHFSRQLDPDQTPHCIPARVMAVHRGRLVLAGDNLETQTPPYRAADDDDETAATIGDWLLLDAGSLRPFRLLDRRSLFKRRAPGTDRHTQLIAANVDTLFIVSSCNSDFSLARLERYLALARDAEVTPVVVLTKADQTDTPDMFSRPAQRLLPGLLVETLDARDASEVARLAPWCGVGQTIAFAGSSGVGKSTLINTLLGSTTIVTQAIREHDGTGQHTTTGRALHRLPAGGWLMDTPGMRELGLSDAAEGIASVFADIVALAAGCRFADCRHETEPGCAVADAIGRGELDPARLHRWRKLVAEEAFNNETLAERRARGRAFSKIGKRAMREKRARRE